MVLVNISKCTVNLLLPLMNAVKYICIAHCRFLSVNALITVNKVYFFNDLMALNNKKATHQHMPDVVIGPLESAESDTGPQ